MVSHDREKRQIIPISEFVSTGHTSLDISKYLQSINHLLENYKLSFAPLVVTDFSYSLINAVMDSVNKCSLVHYLNWCFDIFFKYREEKTLRRVMKTRLILCSTHFLKSLIKKVKNIEKKNSSIARTFILCFSLLQNSVTAKEFNENLMYIHDIFNEKSQTYRFADSYDKLKNLLKQREINRTEIGIIVLLNRDYHIVKF